MGIFDMFGKGFDTKLEEARATENARIIDVRTTQEYRSGHVPGAENVPLDRIDSLEAAPDTPLFVYCQSGARSSQAARVLESRGFLDVTNLGGIMSYRGPIE
ncbi:MAG: rhodanese-like domain-containing protein [Slackia sp.]|nr:rhodanese-like domain-containing protein [Slackia sp.]